MQEILGGRGKATQYRDLIKGVFIEELSHVELVQHTINQLLTGSTEAPQDDESAPLTNAVNSANPQLRLA
ncbi:manganese catalase family protein [Brevibacillus composti]|uniref:Manganese catalase family protein n=1 Tax=Brevibacillus composti TaxID=2796470 RepID=A0A7T5JQ57_9BACL|nr:manganese catalase family protein [Brevibacillus composti]QUO42807.1 manganese catalase family protein [Brevibacillus composti]